MDSEKVGKFLKELRESKKLTQDDLADALFVDRTLISKWENGKISVDLKYMPNISNILDVGIQEIICGEKSTNNSKDEINRKATKYFNLQSMKYKKIKCFSIFLILTLFLGLFSFLLYYFHQTYNTTKVYRVYGESESYNVESGIMIVTRENTYLKIGNIEGSSNNIILYFKSNNDKKIIYKGNSNNVLVDYFKYDGFINLNNFFKMYDKLYLEIDNQEMELLFIEDFENDSLLLKEEKSLSDYSIYDTNKTEIPQKIKEDFECDDDICTKIISDNLVVYDKESNIFNINNNNIIISYDIENKIFYYKDEKEEFNLKDDELECLSQKCNNYKKYYDYYFIHIINNYVS